MKIYHRDRGYSGKLDRRTKNFRPLCQRRRRRRRNLRRSRTGLLRTTSPVERLEQSRDPETKQCMVTLPNAVRAASCSGTVPDMYEPRAGRSSRKRARQRHQHCVANAQDDHAWFDGMVTQHGAWLLSASSLKKIKGHFDYRIVPPTHDADRRHTCTTASVFAHFRQVFANFPQCGFFDRCLLRYCEHGVSSRTGNTRIT